VEISEVLTTKDVLQIHLQETNTSTITIAISPVIKEELGLIHQIQHIKRKTKDHPTEVPLPWAIRIKLHGMATIWWVLRIKMDNQKEKRTYMSWPSLTHTLTLFSSQCQEQIPLLEEINSQSSNIIQLPKLRALVDRVLPLLVKTMMKMRVSFPTTLPMMTSEDSLRTNTATILAVPYPKVWCLLQEALQGHLVTTTFQRPQALLYHTLEAMHPSMEAALSDWWSTKTQVMGMKMISQMRTTALKVRCPQINRTTWFCTNRIRWLTLNTHLIKGKYFLLRTMMIWAPPLQMMMMTFKDSLQEVKEAIQIIHPQAINHKPKTQGMDSSPLLSFQVGIIQVAVLNNTNQTHIYRWTHSVIDYMSFW
jgi:hypothetical protein